MRNITFISVLAILLAVASVSVRAQYAGSLQQAEQDRRDRNPFFDIPADLKKPVFLKSDSYVCETSKDAANPNKEIMLTLGVCKVTKATYRAIVLPPGGEESYLDMRMYKIVRVAWSSETKSDGTVFEGWTAMSNIRN